uniref:Phosphatidylinositol 3,4,5-trisphosphate-dependent Rac exchanger 1 protein n=1 Tax=Latimeria chalumnae TaxID=7897 RepID=H3B2M2_LATCH
AFLCRIQQNATDKAEKYITEENVKILFSNIEGILGVHKEFLAALEHCLQPEPQPQHELGNVFLGFKEKFCVYEEYCSNHEKALRLLMELNKIPAVRAFLLSCMLLGGRKTTDIPLEGYLLTPIQRICKYPLLLKELLKRTPSKHSDHAAVQNALQAMKAVCTNINETKRQMEKLEALEQLQSHIEGWEGSNLTDICTELLLQGNLLKISAGNIQERVFFLFDNLLVYCKRKSRVAGKKSTKRTKSINGSLYIFRGRINTEVMEVENVEDGTADYHSNGYTVTNGWKIHNTAKNKWFVCMAKTAEDKQKWLDAILKEREQRESLKLGMERDAYAMISEKGEKLYHMIMSKKGNLIKDRRKKFSTIPKCFLGNEFVSWLLETGEISKAEEGVNLGQALLENGIIHHVSDKHQFKNEHVFYRFRYDDGTYKPRSELEDIMSKGVRLYCRLHSLFTPVIKDRDYHLKTYKSVIPASKLVDWLIAQGDCQSREEAVALGIGLCNNGFMHHVTVLEKSEFKDESQFFRFYADEEMEGISCKNKQIRSDFKLIENIVAKSMLILPQEDDYGFEIEEKNKTIVVKSVQRGSHAEMAGLQIGRKIYSINEDLVFLRPFQEVETILNLSFCCRRPLRVLVATKVKEIIKVPDCSRTVCFQIRGAAPPYVHAVRRGSEAAAAGLYPGQCIHKVNGNNVSSESYTEVLEHFTAYRNNQQMSLGSPQWVFRMFEDAQEERALNSSPGDSDLIGDDSHRNTKNIGETVYSQRENNPVIKWLLQIFHKICAHYSRYQYSCPGLCIILMSKHFSFKFAVSLSKGQRCFPIENKAYINYYGMSISLASITSVSFSTSFAYMNEVLKKKKCPLLRLCGFAHSKKLKEMKSRILQRYKKKSLLLFRTCNHLPNRMKNTCFLELLGVFYTMSRLKDGKTANSKPAGEPNNRSTRPTNRENEDADHEQDRNAAGTKKDASAKQKTPQHTKNFTIRRECRYNQASHETFHDQIEKLVIEFDKYKIQYRAIILILRATVVISALTTKSTVFILTVCVVGLNNAVPRDGNNFKSCKHNYPVGQVFSGHICLYIRVLFSECNSNRDSVLSYTSVRSNSSYLGSDEMGSGDELPCDMRIPSDKQDKLHGCLEHLYNQVNAINALLKGTVMTKAFEETKHFPMDHNLQ